MGIQSQRKVCDANTYRINGPGALPVAHHANADAAAALQAHELGRCELRMLSDEGVQRDIRRKVSQIHCGRQTKCGTMNSR